MQAESRLKFGRVPKHSVCVSPLCHVGVHKYSPFTPWLKKFYVIYVSTFLTSSPISPLFHSTPTTLGSVLFIKHAKYTDSPLEEGLAFGFAGPIFSSFMSHLPDMFSNFLYVSARGGSNSPQQKSSQLLHCPSLFPCPDSLFSITLTYIIACTLYIYMFLHIAFIPGECELHGSKDFIFLHCCLSACQTVLDGKYQVKL